MAERIRKISEVPKGEKLQFFVDYFGLRTILIICAVLCVAYLVYAFNQPRPDARVLMASYKDFVSQEVLAEIENTFNENEMDFNNDGRVMMQINYNYLDQELMTTAPESYVTLQTKLMTSVGDLSQIYHILDESAYQLFLNNNAVGKYAEFDGYETGHSADEYIKIPLAEIPGFENVDNGENLFLTIRPSANAEVNKEKNLENYNNHVDALAKMMGFTPVN